MAVNFTLQSHGISNHCCQSRSIPYIQIIASKLAHAEQRESSALLAIIQDLVAILSHLQISNIVLVLSPETLDLAGTFMFVSHVCTPGTLNTSGHVVPVFVAKILQGKDLPKNEQLQNKQTFSLTIVLTVSGWRIKTLDVPICHSSAGILLCFRISSAPLTASPFQIYSPA